MRINRIRAWTVWLFLLLLSMPSPLIAQSKWRARERQCVELFRSNQFLTAAQCFEGLAQVLNNNPQKKYYRGRLLRNAALLYQKAAKYESPTQQKKFYQQAVLILNEYLQNQLCEIPFRCKEANELRTKLLQKLGYVYLTIHASPSNAKIAVEGLNHEATGKWEQLVLPGSYRVDLFLRGWKSISRNVKIPRGKATILRYNLKQIIIHSSPNGQNVVRRATPPSKKKSKAFPVTLVGIGTAGLVTGSVFLIMSLNTEARRKELRDGAKAQQLYKQALKQNHIGWGAASAGSFLIVTGLIIYIVLSKKEEASPPAKATTKGQGYATTFYYSP